MGQQISITAKLAVSLLFLLPGCDSSLGIHEVDAQCYVSINPDVPHQFRHGLSPQLMPIVRKLEKDYLENNLDLDFFPIVEGTVYVSAACGYVERLRLQFTGTNIVKIDEVDYLNKLEQVSAPVQVLNMP